MKTLAIELRKEKRTGIGLVLIAAGISGALYAFANYAVRKEALLNIPLPAMDLLLTQLYGMIMIMNLFGIIVAACAAYDIEFCGNAAQKMYTLPVSGAKIYFSKFMILTFTLFLAVALQNGALWQIGKTTLPAGAFERNTLLWFALYSFVTALPVLAFMLLVASRFSKIWVPLGIGVAGFLSGMVLATVKTKILLPHPFVVMLQPAVAMSAQPDPAVMAAAAAQTLLLLIAGLWLSKKLRYE